MHQVRQELPATFVPPLRSSVVLVDSLTAEDRLDMLALMRRHYDNVTPTQFSSDLDAKRWVIVARNEANRIRGFATQDLQRHTIDGVPIRVLFSGDTIIDRRYWSNNHLIGTWGQFALDLADEVPDVPLYWHLISKGYKTYRLLPLFFHDFHPRYDRPSSAVDRRRLDVVSLARFPDQYDADAGLVRATANGCRLRDGVADITTARLRDPHVRYFARRNPRHAEGDELSCLAPLSRDNFTAAAYRAIRRAQAPQVATTS